MVGRIELAVLYVVVASMVIKPTGDDGAVLFALVLLVSAAAAGALAWRRRLAASEAHP
jgi:LPXTG-motif cell wall-anchored protein